VAERNTGQRHGGGLPLGWRREGSG
jgi:hypothetical protein